MQVQLPTVHTTTLAVHWLMPSWRVAYTVVVSATRAKRVEAGRGGNMKGTQLE